MKRISLVLVAAALALSGCSTFQLKAWDSNWTKAGKVTARTVVGLGTLGLSELAMDRQTQPWKYQRQYRPIDPGAAIILNGYLNRRQYQQPAPMVMPNPAPYYPPPQRTLYCTPTYDGQGGQICR